MTIVHSVTGGMSSLGPSHESIALDHPFKCCTTVPNSRHYSMIKMARLDW